MSETLQWVACGGVGGLAALSLFGNWLLLIGTAKTKKPTSLAFPFLCGPVCSAACWLSPSALLNRWFWVPLVFDFTILVLPAAAVAAFARCARRSPSAGDPDDDPGDSADGGA